MPGKRHILIKRATVWLLETLAEIVLLAAFLGFFAIPHFNPVTQLWILMAVVAMLLGYLGGFFLATGIFALAFRTDSLWFYPPVAATLFTAFLYYDIGLLNEGQPSSSLAAVRARILPFHIGGAFIVFACTFLGGWFLRKWAQKVSSQPRDGGALVPD